MTLGWLDVLALALFLVVVGVNLAAGWARPRDGRRGARASAGRTRRSGWLHR